MPVMKRYWQSEPDGWGGVWKLNGNVLNIVREVGTQTRRLSLGGEWDRTFRDGIGGLYKFTAGLRGAGHSLIDVCAEANHHLPSAVFSVNRAAPLAAVRRRMLGGRG